MNKPLLIVICDFMLISFLSLISGVDLDTEAAAAPVPKEPAEAEEDPVLGARDVVDLLEMALSEEQELQDSLKQERDQYRDQLSSARSLLQDREEVLEATQSALETAQGDLEATRNDVESLQDNLEEARTLLDDREAMVRGMEEERSRLEEDYQSTQRDLAQLQEEYQGVIDETRQLEDALEDTSKQAAISQVQLETISQELNVRRKEATQMQQRMAQLEEQRMASEKEKQQLALDLRESRTQAVLAREHWEIARADVESARADVEWARGEVVEARNEVKVARTEKHEIMQRSEEVAAQVAELAVRSEEFQEEVRTNRPITANSIFNEVQNNSVDSEFTVKKKGGLLGERTRDVSCRSVLATYGGSHFILHHIDDTPLTLDAQNRVVSMRGAVRRGGIAYSIGQIGALSQDPRILAIPVDQEAAQGLGCKIYQVSADPYRFEEAVLVTYRNKKFGEVSFKVDPEHPGYVKMDRPIFSGLLGQFAPSRGDLVFSKTGELLGMMANNKYCLVFGGISFQESTFACGQDYSEGEAERVLARMRSRYESLPFALR